MERSDSSSCIYSQKSYNVPTFGEGYGFADTVKNMGTQYDWLVDLLRYQIGAI